MDRILAEVERQSQGILALSTQEGLVIAALGVTIVGIVALLIWCCTPDKGSTTEETQKMAPPISLSKKDKGLIVSILETEVERRVLFNTLSKRKARKVYHSIGVALDIQQLQYPASAKHLLLHSQRNGSNKTPLPIPGEKPIQDIKPNNLPVVSERSAAKNRVRQLFKAKTA